MSTVVTILTAAASIFGLIEGLKNIPFIAPLFTKYPSLAVWLNAAGALATALITCVSPALSIMCIITAVGTFLGAAGIHNTVSRFGGGKNGLLAKRA